MRFLLSEIHIMGWLIWLAYWLHALVTMVWPSWKVSAYNLRYIGQTRRQLKARLNEHRCKVKNEENYTSSIASDCWSYSHYFDFIKAWIMSSSFYTSYLNFYEAFYILKKSNNLVNDLYPTPSISDVCKLLV